MNKKNYTKNLKEYAKYNETFKRKITFKEFLDLRRENTKEEVNKEDKN